MGYDLIRMRLCSIINMTVLLITVSFSPCVIKPAGGNEATEISIDVCRGDKSSAYSVANALVEEIPVMLRPEKKTTIYKPAVFSLITHFPDPPEKPPCV